jgi:pyruvate dehydrogenase E1 component alpha subunit
MIILSAPTAVTDTVLPEAASLKKMVAEVLGRETGYCKGRGGSMHIADIATGNIGANGIVGGGIPIGVGVAMGVRVRGSNQVTIIFFSDGACNNGVFAESLNLAAIWDLPVVFMLENNQYAVSSPIEEMSRVPDLYKRGKGYGVEAHQIDGNDVLAVYEKTCEAVDTCRLGKGPVLLEAKTYRHSGHHVNDPGTYMPKERLEYYRAHDPIKIARSNLIERARCTDQDIDAIEQHINQQMEEAIEFGKNSAQPSVEAFLEEIKTN